MSVIIITLQLVNIFFSWKYQAYYIKLMRLIDRLTASRADCWPPNRIKADAVICQPYLHPLKAGACVLGPRLSPRSLIHLSKKALINTLCDLLPIWCFLAEKSTIQKNVFTAPYSIHHNLCNQAYLSLPVIFVIINLLSWK